MLPALRVSHVIRNRSEFQELIKGTSWQIFRKAFRKCTGEPHCLVWRKIMKYVIHLIDKEYKTANY